MLIEILLGDDVTLPSTPAVWRNAYRAALRYSHHAAAGVLRRRGVDDSTVTDVDRVIAAGVAGDADELRRLLAQSSSAKAALREDDHRMLSWVIRTGRYHAVPLMLAAGLDPNVPDKDGETPLHLAVRATWGDRRRAIRARLVALVTSMRNGAGSYDWA
jgi:hypothetical protein